MKSLFLSTLLVLTGSLASAYAGQTKIVNPTIKCVGMGDGGGGYVFSIDKNSARVWTVDYAGDNEGRELTKVSVARFANCADCVVIRAESADSSAKTSYEIGLRKGNTDIGYTTEMDMSVNGQSIYSNQACEEITKK